MALRGKWAQGIEPRHFTWILKDKLATSERPGGYGDNHRRVRRQEEIIWIREQGFTCVYSLIPEPHNLHNYDDLGVAWRHRPWSPKDDDETFLREFLPDLHALLVGGGKVLVHQSELGERLVGLMAAYLLWSRRTVGFPQTISIAEQLMRRHLTSRAREIVAAAGRLPGPEELPVPEPAPVEPAIAESDD